MARPESHRDQIIGAIDSLDLGSDLLRTAWLATTADGGLGAEDIEAISATLFHAMKQMRPGRDAMQTLVETMQS